MVALHAKKSLGQHFLQSDAVVEKIVQAGEVVHGDLVVEVGPGEGVLTHALLATGARVVAIEKDARCIPLLTERFREALARKQLLLIEGDVLDSAISKKLFGEILLAAPAYKVVANIPYYITGLLFRYFLERKQRPDLLTFLVQKEVAEQIVSKNKKESILSLSLKIFGDPLYVATVPKEAFFPMPKVDSAILTLRAIHDERLGGLPAETFFRIMKVGFRARRKMLLRNLTEGLGIPKVTLETIFAECAIPLTIRGEDLPLVQWMRLVKRLSPLANKKDDA